MGTANLREKQPLAAIGANPLIKRAALFAIAAAVGSLLFFVAHTEDSSFPFSKAAACSRVQCSTCSRNAPLCSAPVSTSALESLTLDRGLLDSYADNDSADDGMAGPSEEAFLSAVVVLIALAGRSSVLLALLEPLKPGCVYRKALERPG